MEESTVRHGGMLPAYTRIIEEYEPRSSKSQSISLLINSAVGAGMLSFPFAFKCAGLVGGVSLLVGVAVMQCFTLYVLSGWADRTGTKTYGELVKTSLGNRASFFLNVSMSVYLFGSGVAYMLIIGDSFTSLWRMCLKLTFMRNEKKAAMQDVWWASRNFVICVVSTVTVLPVCLKKSLSDSAAVSMLNFVAFLAIIGCLVMYSILALMKSPRPFENVAMMPPSMDAMMKAVSISVFCFQCHAQVIAVYNEMMDVPSKVPFYFKYLFRDPKRDDGSDEDDRRSSKIFLMTEVIITAIALTAVGYALVGVPAYLAFPTKVQSNVFNTFDQDEPVMQFARGIVGLLQIASYPVNHFPARAAIGDIVGTLVGQQPSGYAFIYVETLLFFGLNLLIAMYVTDLGAVFEIIGGTCGSIIILGMPSLLLLNHSLKKVRSSKRARGSMSGYLVLLEYWDFWAGMGLLLFSSGLFVYTFLSAFSK
eukprot:jgi/Picsp_1/1585/NSC_05063-R1_sodium-coupled neutral amino acid transporter 7